MSDNVETVEAEEVQLTFADMVDAAINKDYNKANEIFGQEISVKLGDVLDQEKIKIASQMFNGGDDEEDNEEDVDVDETDSEDEDNLDDADVDNDPESDEDDVEDEEVEN